MSSVSQIGMIASPSPTKQFDAAPGFHNSTVYVLTAVGQSLEGWEENISRFRRKLPSTKFVILSSSVKRLVNLTDGRPDLGYNWFSSPPPDADPSDDSRRGVAEERERLENLIDAENAAGIPYGRMIFIGEGQGGAMALAFGLQLPVAKKLGGIVVISSFDSIDSPHPCYGEEMTVPGTQSFNLSDDEMKDLPVFHCVSTWTDVEAHAWAWRTQRYLKDVCGMTAYFCKKDEGFYYDTLSDELLKEAFYFISSCLPNLDLPSEISIRNIWAYIREYALEAQAKPLLDKDEFVALIETHIAELKYSKFVSPLG